MRHPAWWLLAALLAGAAWALDPPRPAPGAPSPPESSPAAEQPVDAGQAGGADETKEQPEEPADEEVPPPPPVSPSTGPTPQRFDPSEEVRADFPVSFPIDI
jgi:hypothetical protein